MGFVVAVIQCARGEENSRSRRCHGSYLSPGEHLTSFSCSAVCLLYRLLVNRFTFLVRPCQVQSKTSILLVSPSFSTETRINCFCSKAEDTCDMLPWKNKDVQHMQFHRVLETQRFIEFPFKKEFHRVVPTTPVQLVTKHLFRSSIHSGRRDESAHISHKAAHGYGCWHVATV